MSLAARASSPETFARRASRSGGDDIHGRRMSFNPVSEWTSPVVPSASVGAFEVSVAKRLGNVVPDQAKRLAQVIAAVVYCLFAAGIVFGFAALKPVLIREGVYRDRCTKKELDNNVEICYDQEIHLNFIFTVAAVATNVCALPIGTILDTFGPRITSLIGCVFLATGSLLLAFAWDMRPGDGYIAGYFFLALGGPFIFISSFQLSNAFPTHSGLILALVTGAFDTSSAIFLFYRLIYTASDGSFWPKKFFLVYLIVPAVTAVVQLTLMPYKSYKTIAEVVKTAEDKVDEETAVNPSASDQERERLLSVRQERRESIITEVTALLGTEDASEQAKKEEEKRHKSGVWGALHGKSARQQIMTPWFGLIAIFTLVQMLRINYFVATIRAQYTFLLQSPDKAHQINGFFDIALPLGGVIAIPFIGLVLDNTSTPFVLSLLVTLATIIGVLGVLPFTWAAYANVVLFVVYRPLYYTTVSDYAAKVFGFVTFGKVYGLIICLAGLFNFLQTPLDAATHTTFHNDPRPINIILLVIALSVGIALVSYVAIKGRRIERERLEDEAEGARETLMPGADPQAQEDHHPIDVHGYETTSNGTNRRDAH